MNYFYDHDFKGIICTPDCADEYLELISDIAFDYDGCHTEKELKKLIDEMSDLAKKARQCITEEKIVTNKEESAKSRKEAENTRRSHEILSKGELL